MTMIFSFGVISPKYEDVLESQIQLNLVNLKSSRLEVLFPIISKSNYREVDIK